MKNHIKQLTLTVMAALLLFHQDAMAAKVYQWVDEEGVAHFSDIPPVDNPSAEIQEINFTSYAASDIDTDEYSIVNQLERMAEWRRQTEEERLARKQLQLEEKRLAQEKATYQIISPPGTRGYYSSAYYYPHPGYPGNFGGYNKWHSKYWNNHHGGSGHGSHGNTAEIQPQYKLKQYKVGSGF